MEQEKKLHALIVGGSREYIWPLKQALEQSGRFDRSQIAYSGSEAYEKACVAEPDLIITDIVLRGLDGLSLLEKLQQRRLHAQSKILVCTCADSEFIIRKSFEYGADFFLVKPFSRETLLHTLKELLSPNVEHAAVPTGNVEEMIQGVIQRIGLPPGSKGYHYAKTAIKYLLQDRMLLQHMTTQLYPEIAEAYGSTSSRVERNIRHAVEVAWNKGDLAYIERLFGYTVDAEKGKPTNTAFLAAVSDYIKLRMYRIN